MRVSPRIDITTYTAERDDVDETLFPHGSTMPAGAGQPGWAGFWPVQYFGGLPLFKKGAAACHDWNATLKWDASAALSPAELEHVARHGLSRFGSVSRSDDENLTSLARTESRR